MKTKTDFWLFYFCKTIFKEEVILVAPNQNPDILFCSCFGSIENIRNTKANYEISASGMPSGWGIIVFQLGWIGIILILMLVYQLFSMVEKSWKSHFFLVCFLLIYVGQMLFTLPLFVLCIAAIVSYQADKKEFEK